MRGRRTFSVAAVSLAVASAAGAGAGAGTAFRATLGASTDPLASGVFVAQLSGRTLSWRLTFNGLTGPATAARLRLAPAGTVRLCAPCVTGAQGKTMLASLRNTTVEVGTARSPQGEIRGPIVLGTVPTLQLLLGDGATIRLPAAIRYVVTGFRVGSGAGKVVAMTGGRAIELAAGLAPGVVYLPDDKLLTGRRDLTFLLTRANGVPLANREARATIFGVRITGRR